jgi:hypothetical protein
LETPIARYDMDRLKTKRIFMLRTKPVIFVVLAVALALSGVAPAQAADDVAPALGINYFDNANNPSLPDGTVRITTPHLRTPAITGTHGMNQCALIYVLKPDQELAACCGCPLTPDQLLKLSVNKDLTANTYGAIGPSGTIAIVPSFPNCDPVGAPPVVNCDPGLPPLTGEGLPAVTAWATHVQDSGLITEDDFDFETNEGTAATVAALVADCASIEGNGSGAGVCTCGQ